MPLHLLDNNTLGWEPVDPTAGQSIGNAFTTSGGYANKLGWYRYSTGQPGPSSLSLWRSSTQAELVRVTPADSGAVGWQWTTLYPSVPLFGSVEYVAAAHYPNGSRRAQGGSSGLGTPPSPLVFGAGPLRYTINVETPTFPSSTGTGYGNGTDLEWDADALNPGPGEGGEATTGDLASWLSSNALVQTHETDGVPWKTHAEVTHAGHGLSVLGELIGDVLEDAGTLLGRVPATLGATLTTIKDAVTVGPLPGIAGLETLANNILGALETAAQYLANPSGGAIGALRNTPAVPGSGWTLINTVDFTFQKAWDVPADLYVLTSAGYPPNFPLQDVDGAPWRPRAGWWAVRNGDAFLGRQFIEWDVQHLVDGGRRMPGVVVRLQPGVEATLEAWRLT